MFYVYIVAAAAALPILNIFFDIFKQSYSWWLAPLIMLGVFLGLIILHILTVVIWVNTINVNKPVKNAKAFRCLIKHTVPLILKLARVTVNAEGTDIVPEEGRFLFVCNHQHDFDPIIILSVFSDYEIGFVGKKEIYETMPFIAKAMHGLYGLPIDRENNREAAKTIIKATSIIKEDKASIGLFPEGYASKTCEILPIRSGSLKIAYRADVPIVVSVINNTRSIWPNLIRHRTVVDFKTVKVITTDEFKDKSTTEIGDEIYSIFETELNKLRNK